MKYNKSIWRRKHIKSKKRITKHKKHYHTKKRITKKNNNLFLKGGNQISLQIKYSNMDTSITNNENITEKIKQLKSQNNTNPPEFEILNASPDSLYLISMTDPDAPPGTFTHWIFTIKNNKIIHTYTEYMHPSPPSDTHKYIFNIYEIQNNLEIQILNNLNEIKNNKNISRVEITNELNNIINSYKLISLATHQFLVSY
jgi:phosphatidylethanolamine-binding protein (PEBP) family uncharacterized protein